MTAVDRVDPFTTWPAVPSEWLIVRRLLQAIVAVACLWLPAWVTWSIERRTSGPIASAAVGVGVPMAGVVAGWLLRVRLSRIAGTLLIVGSAVPFGLFLLLAGLALLLTS